ncbi:LysR family transcriptional regulator [Herbaspirillum rubrisubalbicans]|uniref:LysR family transcriptional regulator n=2 Tax=Herbaspirillum rubrisubalbicans TaxID=80842 RepID=A0AAD0XH56_9BURK|nr:LysR family transcriptional regulator [Herbaspirillum rubrisubalbicans]ALU90129.1 LysR family transcription regulator protein [Herbaspirillum rubrisubalbicans M1]AYR25162.1 LysR family transcriptional regulator [Herbaspirillum rubrisubalbicans]NQE47615.1 LysR family transcriptional regulator [Herbaspirillum rubrisubalbicans]QJQ01796.1 LysR family transcriptional regulator [Herbaspirillum rubrisubalbicans Os34]RAM64918.1 LysR family transcriptional regulator [Herbaspirillum rubrisubalbicans]
MSIQSEELRTFVAVVEAGTLSSAAEVLEQTTSGVSRALSRLEEKLGASLLTRTTRRMELTEEGEALLHQARAILGAMEQAEDTVRMRSRKPVGKLRVDAAVPFMLHCVVPHVGAFRAAYPDIELELTTNDRFIDLVEQRADIAIRIGELQDSTLHARPLSSARLNIVASPDYLARCGTPESVEALEQHQLIGFSQPDILNHWPLRHTAGDRYQTRPAIRASSGETIRHLALQGQGIACLSSFMTDADIAAGHLVRLLDHYDSGFRQKISAVYYHNTQLSRRISCFLDFLQCKL